MLQKKHEKKQANTLEEQREMLKQSREEATKLIENAKKQGEVNEKIIIQAARAEAERLKESCKTRNRTRKRKSSRCIREQVASLSVLIASKVIEKELTEADQEK